MSWVSGWRLALRLAWREAWRAKGRSLLVLVMVTFPVVAVIAADVAEATSSVSSVEGLDRRIGSAEARVTTLPGASEVFQTADPDGGGYATKGTPGTKGSHRPPASLDQVRAALGGSRPVIELRTDEVRIRTEPGQLQVDATGVDLHDPLSAGLFRLTSGRWPRGAHEVAMNAAFAGKGYAVGDLLTEADGSRVTVVGTAESTGPRTLPVLVGDPDWLPAPSADEGHIWLVGGAPVTWSEVLAVNRLGALVLSRHVVEHPPSIAELSPQIRGAGSADRSTVYAVLALVGVMALLEVVLLAGPAFAVGARRQSRSLALIAANGGTPTQSRRVILGTAVVIGGFAAVAGVGLGIGLGRVLVPVLQSMSDTWFGPFQIRWEHVLGIAAFGLLSAFLAAVVPAWIASRQDVVAVLAGRRGDRAASRRSPFIGVALLGGGIALAVLGSRQQSGEVLIAGAAVLSVFGMVFLVPVVVVAVARTGRRFPLPLRYAVRDAARHRTRTVPAVAAVAATVAGVVALSIGNTSDQAQAKAEYTQVLPKGDGAVSGIPPRQVGAVKAALATQLPGVRVTRLTGLVERPVRFVVPGQRQYSYGYSSMFGAGIVVGDRALRFAGLTGEVLAHAQDVLHRGGAVVTTNGPVAASTVRIVAKGPDGRRSVEVPAAYVDFGTYGTAPMEAVVSARLAARLHQDTHPVGLYLHGPITTVEQDRAGQTLTALSPSLYFYVEHGYQVSGSEKVVLWILFGLAAVLMLGGTLTATFLALSDARPDLATLSAVGASPRMRRAVAAAYAVAIGVVGAVLGAAVGFIPGIAVSYPLTRDFTGAGSAHYLAVPWLQIVGLVVLLPLLTALVVGLLARSRLPLVARLD
jgi:putative ABC transport system permease protein